MPEGTEAEKELYTVSHLINPIKKGGNQHYVPIILGNVNGILSEAKFLTLRILLESGASPSIVLGKYTKSYIIKRPSRSNGAPKVVTS